MRGLTQSLFLLLLHASVYAQQHSIRISPSVLKEAQIQVAVAKPGVIQKKLLVVGKITPNLDTSASIFPRYSGIIKTMTKNLGDDIQKGEVLVTIESNESLQNYNMTSPINGTIVQKKAITGELAKGDKPLYEIANLATVWADLTLYRKEAPLVKTGMSVLVTGDEGKPQSQSRIHYISPLGVEDSQTTLARAILTNEARQWLPGMYVEGAITLSEKKAPLVVTQEALQRIEGQDVVFVQDGEDFNAAPVSLGDSDGQWVEITKGLQQGQKYVSHNSFFLKAELGKSNASHEH